MKTQTHRPIAVLIATAFAALLAFPAIADAYTVTVHVHGAGAVVETTPAALMNCTTASNVSESTVTDCTSGSPSGDYGWGWTVALQAQVPQAYYDRGWRRLKWVDSSASGQIDCDPSGTYGDLASDNCQFAIFANVQTNLYFDDTFGPNATSISTGPANPTKQTSATFAFNASDDPDALYDCRLDRPGLTGSYVACGSPVDKGESYSSLNTNGAYTFYVRGRDPSGNVDATPATYSWVVDTVAPTVTISGTPGNGTTTTNTSTAFSVTTTEGAATCTLDGAPVGCGVQQTGLSNGTHTFVAQATDSAGNTGSASRTWTVDTVAPTVTISGTPADGATTTSPGTAFTVTTTSGTLSCTIDGQPQPCATDTANLATGSHTFIAQATDGAKTGSDSRTWTVVAPDTTISSGPVSGSITGATVSFVFTAEMSAECNIDDGTWVACSSPQSYTLPGGSHSFSVRAKNGPNVDPTPATRTWIVDADGDGSIVPQDCRDTDSASHPGATDIPGDGIDQDCSGADATAEQTSSGGPSQVNPLTPSLPAAPTPAVAAAMPASVANKLVVSRRGTLFKRLIVVNLPSRSTVAVRCKGSGCPRKSFTKSAGSRLLLKPFMGKLLKPRTRLTIAIKAAGFRTKTVTYLIRANKKPKITVT